MLTQQEICKWAEEHGYHKSGEHYVKNCKGQTMRLTAGKEVWALQKKMFHPEFLWGVVIEDWITYASGKYENSYIDEQGFLASK